MTQEELGDRLGVKKAAVSNWEQSMNGPGNKLHKLAEVLGCSPDDLGVPLEMREGTEPLPKSLRIRCAEHLQIWLDQNDSPEMVGWTLVELRRRFPVSSDESGDDPAVQKWVAGVAEHVAGQAAQIQGARPPGGRVPSPPQSSETE